MAEGAADAAHAAAFAAFAAANAADAAHGAAFEAAHAAHAREVPLKEGTGGREAMKALDMMAKMAGLFPSAPMIQNNINNDVTVRFTGDMTGFDIECYR